MSPIDYLVTLTLNMNMTKEPPLYKLDSRMHFFGLLHSIYVLVTSYPRKNVQKKKFGLFLVWFSVSEGSASDLVRKHR